MRIRTHEIPSAHDNEAGRAAAFYVALGGALAWLVHLLAMYAVAEGMCVAGVFSFEAFGLSGVQWLLAGVSVPLFGAALGAMVVSLRFGRDARNGENAPNTFLGRFGALSNGAFAVVIIAESLPILFWGERC